ncbi:MAG TPA: hypothetical protein VK186_07240 [Candidatus Deferrimicrobium sp.]|nr:hypothetical protein [Candidatus Deferrimicrobium sp.]
MDSYIIDTNVLVVANEKHSNAGFKDVIECQRFLIDIKNDEKRLSVDSLGLIFKEYFSHASMAGQPGIGDAFAKWFFLNQWNDSICVSSPTSSHPGPEKKMTGKNVTNLRFHF